MFASKLRHSRLVGPSATLSLPILLFAALMLVGCGEDVGSCVQVYQFEGTVEKTNYTRSECEEECAAIGRTLQCYFQGNVASATGPSVGRLED